MPRKVFTAGEVLAAADVNSFLMDQTVMSFAGTAARGSAIGTATEGMTTYLEDSNSYESYSGAAWLPVVSTGEWTSFTPSWAGLTVGNGTYSRAAYTLIGKTAQVKIRFIFGSTSAVTGAVTLTVPVILTRKDAGNALATGWLFDTGSQNYIGAIQTNIANNREFLVRFPTPSGSALTLSNLSSTAPHTWANTDVIDLSLSYEVA